MKTFHELCSKTALQHSTKQDIDGEIDGDLFLKSKKQTLDGFIKLVQHNQNAMEALRSQIDLIADVIYALEAVTVAAKLQGLACTPHGMGAHTQRGIEGLINLGSLTFWRLGLCWKSCMEPFSVVFLLSLSTSVVEGNGATPFSRDAPEMFSEFETLPHFPLAFRSE